MAGFELDSRLARDCIVLGRLDISQLLLMNNALVPVSYTHLTLPTMIIRCRSRWSPYH